MISLCAALLLSGAMPAPAGAVGTFGPRVPVVEPTCNVTSASGDAVVGLDGTTRGFVAFDGTGCSDRIRFFEGAGGGWSKAMTRYRGVVLATAYDGTGAWLLYANGSGIRVGQRTNSGTYRDPVRVDSKGLTGAIIPSGDLVASGGRWLAVWNRQVGPGGEFAQTELFSAQTLGMGHCFSSGINRQRITNSNAGDDNPTLLTPDNADGKVRLLWDRNDSAQGERADLRIARMPLDDCRWRQRLFTAGGDLNVTPDAARGLEAKLVTWQRDGKILVDGGSAFGRRRLGTGFAPDISHTAATTHVAWNTFAASRHVRLAERAGGTWTTTDVTAGLHGDQQLIGVTGTGNKATVLIVNLATNRLYARSQR
ncbi:MAG: hypothetical protein H0V19_04930 [Euzebyales bacterium]|nr:hypothetical protein [Euzebyales bacterium]